MGSTISISCIFYKDHTRHTPPLLLLSCLHYPTLRILIGSVVITDKEHRTRGWRDHHHPSSMSNVANPKSTSSLSSMQCCCYTISSERKNGRTRHMHTMQLHWARSQCNSTGINVWIPNRTLKYDDDGRGGGAGAPTNTRRTSKVWCISMQAYTHWPPIDAGKWTRLHLLVGPPLPLAEWVATQPQSSSF